jgi:hypothetical protein
MLGKKFQGIGGQKYLEERAHVQMTGCNATYNGLKLFLKEYLKNFHYRPVRDQFHRQLLT